MTKKVPSVILSIIIIIILIMGLITPIYCDEWDPFHTKEEKIDLWMQLWNSTPNATYSSVGKTYQGKDIWMFEIGNPIGNKILWDGEMHGNEDKGSEVLYLIAEWLIKSNDVTAKKILQNNYLMFIPILNVDSYDRGNNNTEETPYGVNLNRNFQKGWRYAGINPSNPPHSDYSGPYPASEPETQVLLEVFNSYRPDFYVNLHCGTRRSILAYHNEGNIIIAQKIIDRVGSTSLALNVTPYRTASFGSEGYAIGDASDFGISAWILEVEGEEIAWLHTEETYQYLVNVTFPKCLSVFIAMCDIPEISIKTCDTSGLEKNTFDLSEKVYVTGQGFSGLTIYSIYLVNDTFAWFDGMNIPEPVTGSLGKIATNSEGDVFPTTIWREPITGQYDIVVDINDNKKYDSKTDLVYSNIKIIEEEIIPEFQEIHFFIILLSISFLMLILKKSIQKY